MNPQNTNAPGGMQNFDGFGGPNISYESFNEAPKPAAQPIPQQQINVVNANGLVSGQKMVEYVWKRLAYCGLVFSVVFLIGLIVAVIFVGMVNTEKAKIEEEKAEATRNLNGLYEVIGASGQENAIQALKKESEYLNGGDIQKIDKLLTSKYGEYLLDYADSNISFVRINNMFKVVSLGVVQPNGTIRVVLYSRIADGDWKLGGFDSTNLKDPCTNSSEEEKRAIKGLLTCAEANNEPEPEEQKPEEPDPEEQKPDEQKPEDQDPDAKKPGEDDDSDKDKEKAE